MYAIKKKKKYSMLKGGAGLSFLFFFFFFFYLSGSDSILYRGVGWGKVYFFGIVV